VKRLQIHWPLTDGHARRAEHIGGSSLQLPLTFRDLVRMNLKLLRQFCQRALAPYSCQCHLRLNVAECVRRVLFVIVWRKLNRPGFFTSSVCIHRRHEFRDTDEISRK
jgi:hypothetical protein